MLHRRDAMIRLGQLGAGALSLPTLLQARAEGPLAASRKGNTADSCIYLFLWGGPPQHDLWDPKPDAPPGVRSLFRPVATAVPGIALVNSSKPS